MNEVKNQKGFAIVEAVIVLLVFVLVLGVGFFVFSRVSSQDSITADAIVSENLEKTREKLVDAVNTSKTIPRDITEENGIEYSRVDNQTAKLCATFAVPRSGESDTSLSPVDVYRTNFGTTSKTYMVYRDDVDFYNHVRGRNCYEISYAPINAAYEDRFKGDDKNWQVCDSYRQYFGRYTGQTIQGFEVEGPITVGASEGRNILLADDIDVYDENCVKIPLSDLDVGDKVELYIETFDHTSAEFVKAIKKTQ